MAGRFSVEAVFKAVDRVTAPVSRMQNRVGKFTRSAERNFRKLNRTVNKFGKGLKRGAVTAAASLTIVAVALSSVVATGAEFEQAITNVGAVSLKTRAEIAPLEQMALQLGRSTKFTATQAANAMEVLSRAGFKTQDILQATPAILSAAAASGLEIAEVADVVSNALKGMGLETKDASMVADVLTLAASKTNSTIGSLGESIRNVAATASQLNVPFKEVAAAVALLQDAGLDASVSGSAFNTMLTKMAAPTVGMQKKMRRLGISFKNAKGDMLTLPKVLGQLSKASDRLGGNFDKVAFLAELVGLRGQKAASLLTRLFEKGKFTKLSKELDDFNGKAKEMADIRMNTFTGSMLLLSSAIDAVKVKIFGMNEGPLKDAVDGMTEWIGKHEDLIASNIGRFLGSLIENISGIVTWTERIAKGMAVFLAFAIVLKSFIAIMTAVNLVMALNPIALVIIGVGLLIVALGALLKWIGKFRVVLVAVSTALAVLAVVVGGPIGLLIGAAALVVAAWEPLSAFFNGLFEKIGNVASAAVKFLGFGSGDDEDDEAGARTGPAAPQMVSPQDRIARSVEEHKTTSTAEVTIKDESGRAEVTGGSLGKGLQLQTTGAF